MGDRVGAMAGESSELAAIPLPLIAVAAIVAGALIINEVTDSSESD